MKKKISILIIFVIALFIGIINTKAYSAYEQNAKDKMHEQSSGAILNEYCYYNQSGRPKSDRTFEVIIAASVDNKYVGADVFGYVNGKMNVKRWNSSRGCPMAVVVQTDFDQAGGVVVKNKYLYAIYSVPEYNAYITSFENDRDNAQYTYLLVKKTNVISGETTTYYKEKPVLTKTCSYNFDLRGTKRSLTLKFDEDNMLYGLTEKDTFTSNFTYDTLEKYFYHIPLNNNYDVDGINLSSEFMLNLRYDSLIGDYCPRLTACRWKGRATWIFYENIDKETGFENKYCDTQSCSNTDDSECNPDAIDTGACRSIKSITDPNQRIEYCKKVVKSQNYTSPCTQVCIKYLDESGVMYDTQSSDCGFANELVAWIENIFRWIRYIVPVLVIALSILDFIKALASEKEDEMKKAQKHFVTRLIVAALIFIFPTILEFILDKMGFDVSNCGINNIGF